MPLPSLDKAYDYTKANQTNTTSTVLATDAQAILRKITDSLLALASPLTCRGSSNGTGTGALDGVNRWLASANIVWALSGTNHSWICFTHPGTGVQFVFDLVQNTGNSPFQAAIVVVFSPSAGFTGGTATARPTATDEKTLAAGPNGPRFISTTATNAAIHVIQSTDQQVLNILVYQANVLQWHFHLSKPKNPISGWTSPAVYWSLDQSGTPGTAGTFASHHGLTNAWGYIGAAVSFYLTGEAYNSTLIESAQNFADDDTAEWPFGGIGLYSLTASHRGRKGTLFDMYWGSTLAVSGDNYPSTGTYLWWQVGNFIIPGSGSALLTA